MKDKHETEHPPEYEEIYVSGDRVLKKGDKYYCPECKAEIPVRQACHTCGKEIDWDRVFLESRR